MTSSFSKIVAGATRRPCSILIAAVAAALVAPAAAQAAQGFVGVTDHDQVVRLADQTLPGVSTPVTVRGLRQGDAIIALDRAPSGALLALGRSSAIYTLHTKAARVTEKLPPFTGSIDADGPVTFAVAADGRTVRVIARGLDAVVDLANGAVVPSPPLAYAPGDPHAGQTPALAADTLPDGLLVGVDVTAGDFVVQRSVGGPLVTSAAVPGTFQNPTRLTVAGDGSAWLAARLGSNNGRDYEQSRLVRFDPATGAVSHGNGPYLMRELVALAAVGSTPADNTVPRATITVPRHESLASIRRHHGVVSSVRVSEGGQTAVTVSDPRGRTIGFGFALRDDPGRLTITSYANSRGRSELGRLVGERVRLHFTVHDFAGHKRVFDRWTTIAR
jgi:uncharacterized protein DUF4394